MAIKETLTIEFLMLFAILLLIVSLNLALNDTEMYKSLCQKYELGSEKTTIIDNRRKSITIKCEVSNEKAIREKRNASKQG